MNRRYLTSRRALLIVAIVASCSIAIYAARLAWPRAEARLLPLTVTIEPGDFDLRITANGELQSAESLTIAVPPVPVERLHIASVVPDGTHVKKGDPIVEFDPSELDLKALEHKSDLEAALQKINKGELAGEIDKTDIVKDKRIAELELEKISEFLPRDERLYSRREIIEGELDRGYAQRKIVFADVRLELKGKVYSLDEAILMLERRQVDNRIDQTQKARASLKLLAPASGIVVYNDPGYFFGGYTLMPGRTVWIGMTLFNLVNPEKMEAKCFVLEKDAGELRIDQKATVRLDPFPGLEFAGKVKSIDKLARPIDWDSPVKYFQTIVSLDKAEPTVMKPGIKLRAEIIAGRQENVIVAPRSAILKKDSGFVAFVQTTRGQFEPVEVTLGRGDHVQVVVTEGLQQGQTLALNPPDVTLERSTGAKKQGAESENTKRP